MSTVFTYHLRHINNYLTFEPYLNIESSFVVSVEHEEAEVQILLCSPSDRNTGKLHT